MSVYLKQCGIKLKLVCHGSIRDSPLLNLFLFVQAITDGIGRE